MFVGGRALVRLVAPVTRSAPTAMRCGSAVVPSWSASSAGPVVGARGYAGTPRRKKKAMARAKAAEIRDMLEYAATFDPLRTGRLKLAQTMDKLGWNFNQNEMISDGLYVDFSMADTYCAFELVDASRIVDPDHADASTTPAGPPPPVDPKTGLLQPPRSTPFPFAPAAWTDPTVGKVLDTATATRHALIRSKGWNLVAIPLPLWEVACGAPKMQHYARRDLLLSMTLVQTPFEARPPTLGSGASTAAVGKGTSAPTDAAGGAAAEISGDMRGRGTSNRSKRLTAMAAESRRVTLSGRESAAAVAGTAKAAAPSVKPVAEAPAPKLSGAAARKLSKGAAVSDVDEAEAGGNVVPRGEGEEEEAEADAGPAARGKARSASAGAAAGKPKERRKEGRGMGGRGR